MVDPPTIRTLTPGQTWMRRLARVSSRRNQVWCRMFGSETLLVVGEPEIAGHLLGPIKLIRELVNFLVTLDKSVWCHEVLCFETGLLYRMNESFFVKSGSSSSLYVRLV